MDSLTPILNKLELCVRQRSWESLETDWLEIKPVPSTGNAWDNIRESVVPFSTRAAAWWFWESRMSSSRSATSPSLVTRRVTAVISPHCARPSKMPRVTR